jgi:hypothetical protein
MSKVEAVALKVSSSFQYLNLTTSTLPLILYYYLFLRIV